MALFFDPNDTSILRQIEVLPPTPGTCVFVDIVGSTALKDKPITDWARGIFNTFTNVRAFLHPSLVPLKSLGDALMFFVSDTYLSSLKLSELDIFAALVSAARDPDPAYSEIKVGACHCQQAFEITFIKGSADVYGKDIDLTARLQSLAAPRQVVMNQDFVQRVDAIYRSIGNKEQFPEVAAIQGPVLTPLKGFNALVPVFRV